MLVTNSDSNICWACAICFRPIQKGSSRLTLVLCPPITTERLTTEDFIRAPRTPPARYRVDQIRQRDGGTWMTLQLGTLLTVNKTRTRDVRPIPRKSVTFPSINWYAP